MAGCFGNDPEDRYYENQLNRYLDSQTRSDKDEQRYLDRLYDEAEIAIIDGGYLYDLWECNPDEVISAVCKLLIESKSVDPGMDITHLRHAALMEFKDTLLELMQAMPSIQRKAEAVFEENDDE